jgi:hypothetical protein
MLCLFLKGRVGVWLVEDVDVYVDDERVMVMLDECLCLLVLLFACMVRIVPLRSVGGRFGLGRTFFAL